MKFLVLYPLLLLSSFGSECKKHLKTSSQNSTLKPSIIEVISGGITDESSRIGDLGQYGGAYRVKVEVNGLELQAVEKKIAIEDYIDRKLTSKQRKKYLDLTIEYGQLAAKRGLGPKIYGYRDLEINSKVTRYIYMEEIGAQIEKLHIFIHGKLKNTSVFHLSEIDEDLSYKKAKKLLTKIQSRFKPGDSGSIYEFILNEKQLLNLEKIQKRLKRTHPDYHSENVMIYFTEKQGVIKANIFGIDWTNANYTLKDLRTGIKRLKAKDLDKKIKRNYNLDYY